MTVRFSDMAIISHIISSQDDILDENYGNKHGSSRNSRPNHADVLEIHMQFCKPMPKMTKSPARSVHYASNYLCFFNQCYQ